MSTFEGRRMPDGSDAFQWPPGAYGRDVNGRWTAKCPVASPPTRENPATIELGGGPDAVLSRVEYWVEDGDHVIRSLEYDVIAGDPDLRTAIGNFVKNTAAYADLLITAEDRTPDDLEHALMIFRRMSAILAQIDAERPRRNSGLLNRIRGHRGQHPGLGWRLHHAARI